MFFFFLDSEAAAQLELSQLEGLAVLRRLTDAVRAVAPTISVGALAALVHITRRGSERVAGTNASLRDMARALGVAPSSLQRQLDLLGDGGRAGGGLGFIRKCPDHVDKRQRLLTITESGRRLLYELAGILTPPSGIHPDIPDLDSRPAGWP